MGGYSEGQGLGKKQSQKEKKGLGFRVLGSSAKKGLVNNVNFLASNPQIDS